MSVVLPVASKQSTAASPMSVAHCSCSVHELVTCSLTHLLNQVIHVLDVFHPQVIVCLDTLAQLEQLLIILTIIILRATLPAGGVTDEAAMPNRPDTVYGCTSYSLQHPSWNCFCNL
jgi:hypothetical protein